MSKVPSPYCIQTESGMLQLTKGTYLTMMKRKSSVIKTLQKCKPISHTNSKKTVKKNMTKSYGRSNISRNQIIMQDKKRNNIIFSVGHDQKLFQSRMILPTIEMYDDNDNQSEWMQIQQTVRDMTLSLSIAAFDKNFMN